MTEPAEKVLFLLHHKNNTLRIGFPIGDLITSLRQWKEQNPDCHITVIRAHTGMFDPGCVTADHAEAIIFMDDIFSGKVSFDGDGEIIKQTMKGEG